MHSKQVPLRLPESLLVDLDALVSKGRYRSRSAAIRDGIEAILSAERQRQIDHEIVDGYTRHPPGEAEQQAAFTSMRDAIAEEPW